MIKNMKMYFVLNTRGTYAVLVKMWTAAGCYQACVPVDDGSPENRERMLGLFSKIRPNFIGLSEEDWLSFDSFISQLDSKGNSIDPSLSLALSLACGRAATDNDLWRVRYEKRWFPFIMGTVAQGQDWNEFMLIPHRETSVIDAFESLREVWSIIGHELHDQGVLRGMSPGGAWLTDLGDFETLYLLAQTARDWNMRLGVNVGGTGLWNGQVYSYSKSKGRILRKDPSSDEQLSLLAAVAEQYKIFFIEDPFHGSDFLSHAYLSHKLTDTMISGRELYGADMDRIQRGFKSRATKAITVTSRHLASISQLIPISDFSRGKGLQLVMSTSDKETMDPWLCDLAVAFGADMLRMGVMGGDNIAKFNRLLELWEDVPNPRLGRTNLQDLQSTSSILKMVSEGAGGIESGDDKKADRKSKADSKGKVKRKAKKS